MLDRNAADNRSSLRSTTNCRMPSSRLTSCCVTITELLAAIASASAARPSRTALVRSGTSSKKLAVNSKLTTRPTCPKAIRDLAESIFMH